MWHAYPSIFWDASRNKYDTFDGFGNIIKHLLENLVSGSESVTLLSTGDKFNYLTAGVLRKFSQTEFSEEAVWGSEDLDYYGWVWIPNACLSKQCKVHVVFHGCGGGVSSIGQRGFKDILEMGALQYGTSLDLIVIFPQVKVGIFNPEFCWNSNGHL